MSGLIKRIFKEENLNSLLITAVFLFLTAWWVVIFFGLGHSDESANHAWSSYYQIVAILGAYIGFFVYHRLAKHPDPALSRRVILLFSIGLLFQAFGQTIYLLYVFILGIQIPHPSYGDIFYFSSVVVYVVAVALFYLDIIVKKNRRQALVAAVFCFGLLAIMQALLLRGTKFNITHSFTSVVDLAFLIVEPIYAALALGALTGTRFLVGYKYRTANILLLAGLVCQFIADFYFLYTTNSGIWSLTGGGDFLCLFAYFITSLGIVQLTTSFIAINIFVVLFNSLFFIQFILSGSKDRFFSNGVILAVCLIISYFLLRRNKNEVEQKKELVRLEALEESHRKLQELDQQKTEFLTIAAHQLRTPVSIIKNYMAMLEDGDYGQMPADAKAVLKNMAESTEWLVRLGDEFVSIAHLEQGATKYHWSEVDLGSLIDGVVKEFRPKAALAGLTINWQRPAERCIIKGDEEKLRLTVANILDNASKYGGESGAITVSLVAKDNNFVFTVADKGLGFGPADKQKFFQKFSRGDNARSVHVNKSTGLGLYIVRKFIEAHGGEVFAESDGLGLGSQFGFCLPAQSWPARLAKQKYEIT